MPNTYYVTYGNSILTAGSAGAAISIISTIDPYNPLGLPPKTMRVQYESGVTPSFVSTYTAVQVSAADNIWDITLPSNYDVWEDAFYNRNSGANLIKVLGANTSGCTSFLGTFRDCTKLTEVPLFDTRTATNMNSMFMNTAITTLPAYSTSQATGLGWFLTGCSGLTGSLTIDCSSCTDMQHAFHGCSGLTTINAQNTNLVTNMKFTFAGCSALTTVGNLYTSAVTDMGYMFDGCSSMASPPVLSSTGSVTDMSAMFMDCTSLVTPPVLSSTSSVTSTSGMFSGCTSLVSAPSMDLSSVTNASSMFYDCSSLSSLPSYSTVSLTNFRYMFFGCTSATGAIPLYDTSSATNVSYMLQGVRNVSSGALALYQQMSTQQNPPSSHTQTFTQCGRDTQTGAQELAQIPSSWGGTGA